MFNLSTSSTLCRFLSVTICLFLYHIRLYGQSSNNTKYVPLSIGAGYGITIASAGEKTVTASSAGNLNLNYYFGPFTSASLEAQYGSLKGGNAIMDESFKQFTNRYFSLMLHADLQVGEVIDHNESAFVNFIRNFYLGTGVGFIANNITDLNKNVSGATSSYKLSSVNLTVPFRSGFEVKINNKGGVPKIKLDLGYEYVTAFGQGLDGYIDVNRSSVPKFYNYIFIGIKMGLGKVRVYSPDAVDSPTAN